MQEKKQPKKDLLIRSIVQTPTSVLRGKAAHVPVSEIRSKKIQGLLQEMKATLANTTDGVGLAAPQIGEGLKIFIVSEEAEEIYKSEKAGKKRRTAEERTASGVGSAYPDGEKPYQNREWKYYVFINPVVKNISKQKLRGPEGCLSVRGKYGTVRRYQKITMEAYDELGNKFIRGTSNFFARVMQHEIDHLNGILFVDKVDEWIEPKNSSHK